MERRIILVVEDDTKSRFAMQSLLQYRGYEVVAVTTQAAIPMIGANHQDIRTAVIDVGLPELEGLEVARELLRKKPGTRIVFVTTHLEAMKLPMVGGVLMLKPIEVETLCKLL